MPKKGIEDEKIGLKRIFEAVKVEDARKFKDEFLERFGDNPKLEKAIKTLEEGFEDAIQYLNEPIKFQQRTLFGTHYFQPEFFSKKGSSAEIPIFIIIEKVLPQVS